MAAQILQLVPCPRTKTRIGESVRPTTCRGGIPETPLVQDRHGGLALQWPRLKPRHQACRRHRVRFRHDKRCPGQNAIPPEARRLIPAPFHHGLRLPGRPLHRQVFQQAISPRFIGMMGHGALDRYTGVPFRHGITNHGAGGAAFTGILQPSAPGQGVIGRFHRPPAEQIPHQGGSLLPCHEPTGKRHGPLRIGIDPAGRQSPPRCGRRHGMPIRHDTPVFQLRCKPYLDPSTRNTALRNGKAASLSRGEKSCPHAKRCNSGERDQHDQAFHLQKKSRAPDEARRWISSGFKERWRSAIAGWFRRCSSIGSRTRHRRCWHRSRPRPCRWRASG